mmetsp:Transcript_39446/g.123435  ORF Transcript_39446/g.123435 Transcript_39446/m.123435 type:complete len:268 (-) Transcript_39446:563-1366(-)
MDPFEWNACGSSSSSANSASQFSSSSSSSLPPFTKFAAALGWFPELARGVASITPAADGLSKPNSASQSSSSSSSMLPMLMVASFFTSSPTLAMTFFAKLSARTMGDWVSLLGGGGGRGSSFVSMLDATPALCSLLKETGSFPGPAGCACSTPLSSGTVGGSFRSSMLRSPMASESFTSSASPMTGREFSRSPAVPMDTDLWCLRIFPMLSSKLTPSLLMLSLPTLSLDPPVELPTLSLDPGPGGVVLPAESWAASFEEEGLFDVIP